jgi:DNA-binding NarL/FixJ family response regulator
MQPSAEVVAGVADIWVLDGSAVYAEMVREMLEAEDDLSCPCCFRTGESLLEHLDGNPAPDAILVDIALPGTSGIDIVEAIHRRSPSTPIVLLTVSEDHECILRAMCAGASGCLLKISHPAEIVLAVREVLDGDAPMTPRIARRILNLFTQLHPPRHDSGLTDRDREVLKRLVIGSADLLVPTLAVEGQ